MNRKILLICIPVLMAMACRPGAGGPELTGLLGLFLNGGPTGQAAMNVRTSNAITDATRVTLTISGSGIAAPIIQNLIKVGTDWSGVIGAIPAGTNRTFLAQAYDASDVLLYQGQATGVTIDANQTASVVIVLQEVTPPPPFTNVAPLIDSLIVSSAQLAPNGTANLNVTAHDPNAGDTITYTWTATAGTFSAPNITNPVYTAPATVGPQTITITVSDQLGATALMNFNVDVQTSFGTGSTVINVGLNTFPVVQNITASPTSFNQNESTSINLTTNDVDGDPLAYAWTSTCNGTFADASVQNPVFTADATAPYGSCNLTVALDDGRGGTGSGTFGIQIAQSGAANIAPQIVSSFQSAVSVNPAGQLTFRVTASDPESTPLSFSWNAASGTAGTPVNTVNGNQTSSEIVWTAPACGSGIQLSVTVTDGDGITSVHNFLPVDISGATTCPQACVDFPAEITSTISYNGQPGQAGTYTCSVSGLILTCGSDSLTVEYEYPSVQAAAAGNFLPPPVSTTVLGFRGNRISIDFNGTSTVITGNLDPQWRVLNSTIVSSSGNQTYNNSNFDANGFPQTLQGGDIQSPINASIAYTYNPGETRPAQILINSIPTGTTSTANFSNGWVTSASFPGGFPQAHTYSYIGTVSMCPPVPLAATTRVSVASDGTQGNAPSADPRLSGDGRYAVFASAATNLVPGDTNGKPDVFLHDRKTGTTTLVSTASGGGPADGSSTTPDITPDGRYVVFESDATNLVAGDTNGVSDIFRRDLQTGTTIRVSVPTGGGEANGLSNTPSISDDGRHIAYQSAATNLDPGDFNNKTDIFVYDAQTGITQTVSVATSGLPASGNSFAGRISGNGRFVAFHSLAPGIILNDTNNTWDVFVRDLQTGVSTRVSVASDGTEGNQMSTQPAISYSGRYIAFQSNATSLVSGGGLVGTDIYVHDRQTATTTMVSVATGGAAANSASQYPDISADGRYLVFQSYATNLATGDTNGTIDAFRHDRQTGVTSRYSLAYDGAQANSGISPRPTISGDGQIGAYWSLSGNLVPNDTNGTYDVFVSPL